MVDNSNSYKDRVSRLISWGHWFMFANIILAMLMATRYIFAIDSPISFVSIIFVISSWIGHFGLLGIISYIVILFPLTFLTPYSKILRGLAAFFATMIIVALLIDGSIYQNYQLHFNLLVFDLNGFNLNNSIGWSSIVLFLVALLIVELTIANLIWKRLHVIRQWNIGNRITIIFVGMFLVSHLIHIWADAVAYRPVIAFDRIFPFSHQSTARSLIKKYGWIDEKHDSQIILNSSANNLLYPLHPLECRTNNDKNLLVITIDTVNSSLVTPEIMPNLFSMAKGGLDARNHLTNSLNVKDSSFSLNTGLPALYRPAFEKQNLTSPLDNLTKDNVRLSFNEKNTRTINNSSMSDSTNINTLIQWINNHSDQQYHADLTLFASQQLDVGDKPLLPFTKNIETYENAPQRILARQYLNTLYYTDKLLGKLFESINLTNTTMVITANRGIDLNKIYKQSSTAYSKVNLHVPMIVVSPSMPIARITKTTSHYDLLPTLLTSHFNCGNPPSDVSIGYSLMSTQASDMLYLGDAQHFSLYKDGKITEIDRQGQYKFFDKNYVRQENGELSFQSLIDLMANIKRFEP